MKLTRVVSDDWEGVYLNDQLLNQGHSVDVFYALYLAIKANGALNIHLVSTIRVDEDWIQSVGQLPYNLSDIPKV